MIDITKYLERISRANFIRFGGKVSKVIGLTIEAGGLEASIGELCYIFPAERSEVSKRNLRTRSHTLNYTNSATSQPSELLESQKAIYANPNGRLPDVSGQVRLTAKVVGFREERTLLMPFSNIEGIRLGDMVVPTGSPFSIEVDSKLLGRVINALGEPIDGNGNLNCAQTRSIDAEPPPTVGRQKIIQPIPTGVKAIDGLTTIGRGQRMGIFAAAGVGKSVLMGMIARNTQADVNVIALIGERRREVQQFIEDELQDEGLARSVVVAATSDQPALMRIQGALVATTIAEYFRDEGKDVMLMMDSATRLAMAQREVGLATGEPPTTRGYTPSVFALLPKLLERAGTTSHNGSITGLYNVLVEADDLNEPVADTMQSILDGHIVLSRELAARNHYPAIDVLHSISRLMWDVTTEEHRKAALKMREVLATYNKAEDLINIGAYVAGSDPNIDYAIEQINKVNEYLIQERGKKCDFNESISKLIAIFNSQEPD